MELTDTKTDQLLQDFVKWRTKQDALLSPIFEQLEAEDMKILDLLI